MKKGLFRNVFVLGIFFMFAGVFVKPVRVQAAAEYKHYWFAGANEIENAKCGKYYFKLNEERNQITYSRTKSGTRKVLASAKTGYNIDYQFISDGKILYYLENIQYDFDKYQSVIYRVNIAERTKRKVCKIRANDVAYLKEYYDKCLYYVAGWDPSNVYQYDLRTKKHKLIVKNRNIVSRHKQYLMFWIDTGGDGYMGPLYVYDCKLRKRMTISKKAGEWNVADSKIYYTELVNDNWDYTSSVGWNIKCCDLSGKNKKTLVRNIEASFFYKISGYRVYYSKFYTNGEWEYYCYNVKTGKTEQLDEDEFDKMI